MTTGKKKFGAFGGVFTPSILTILGVIMYLRLGWVVGNAGLWGSIGIILIAHVISVTTGLSISSIATDKKVGAGGVYYVLSRSLGLPIGGAIGLTLFIGTALSIALYIVGFSGSFNAILGIENSIDNIRLTGSVALLVLTIIAFISTSFAIKTQYFILAAILISLAAIFFGNPITDPESISGLTDPGNVPLETVFAIFFPAVTGFTAGIAMSGDLKDPKKAIPVGTIAAIAVGFIVYISLAIFLFYNVDPILLKTDYSIMEKMALFAPLVVAGIWGATLSSALGGILGGPRILQAMSLDKITPVIFGKEQGKSKEPRIALIVAILLAEGGILIGDLDVVARVVSMFYLAAYGFINISFFLESWASADFRPSFKVNKWFGFAGFLATFGVMFQLDMLAMFMALIIIGGIYLWLTRREIALGTGDIWRSVWSTSVKEGLKRLESQEDHKRNWKPNILLFSGNSEARPYLIEFSQALAGRAGLVTNFDLIENEGMDVLFTKHKQSVKDELLQKYGIFGRRIDVKNIYKGIETIASTFGFSGIDPNTVLMGWARNTKDPIWFAQMTQKLIDLDYNVLYMDYDQQKGFGKREQIDLWWRGISNNAELMLQIAKFISFSSNWRNATIRILLVNDFNVDRRIIENRISRLLDEFRLKAEIKVIDNHLDKQPFYNILKVHSLKSDLVLIGIPNIIEGAEANFVNNTNDLVEIIGTTLLVKASTTFDVTQLGLKEMASKEISTDETSWNLPELIVSEQSEINQEVIKLDSYLNKAAQNFEQSCLKVVTQHYIDFIESVNIETANLSSSFASEKMDISDPLITDPLINISKEFSKDTLPLLSEILTQGISSYLDERTSIIQQSSRVLHTSITPNGSDKGKQIKLNWQKTLNHYNIEKFKPAYSKALKEFGIVSVGIITRSKEKVKQTIGFLGKGRSASQNTSEKIRFEEVLQYAQHLVSNTILDIRNADRELLNLLVNSSSSGDFNNYSGSGLFNTNRSHYKERNDFIDNYGFFWLRNQQLFHHRFEAGIELRRTNMILENGTFNLFEELQENPYGRLLNRVDYLETNLRELTSGSTPKDSENIPMDLNIPMFDYLPYYRRFMKSIAKATTNLPAEVEMMDTNSQINIQDKQGKGIETVSFSVDKIAEYLIETKFVSLVHENLELFNKEINIDIGELINISNEIENKFKAAIGSITLKEELIKDYLGELEQERKDINSTFETFKAELTEKLRSLMSQLEVQHIIDQSEVLKQYIRKKEIQSGLKGQIRTLRSNFNTQLLSGLELLRRQNIQNKKQALKEEINKVVLPHEQAAIFADKLELDQLVANSLPFYYRQLFSGKHLQSQKTDSNRGPEISLVKSTIERLDNGLTGGLMISGPSLSGKSFLTEKIVNQIIQGKVFYIRPPKGGAMNLKDLDFAFSNATGINGKCEAIIGKMKQKSIFVFSDFELWWLNHPQGSILINRICKLAEKITGKHYFIFNGNIHALKQMRQTSRISEVIAQTIFLHPFSKQELKNEILKRHKTGGLSLYLHGSLLTQNRMDRHVERFFKNLHVLSDGNIGKAFYIWLKSIQLDEEGKFELGMLRTLSFPESNDADWSNLLLQMDLHQSLSHERFNLLFETKSEAWRKKMLRFLLASNLLETSSNMELKLKKQCRVYIEDYLIEKGILK